VIGYMAVAEAAKSWFYHEVSPPSAARAMAARDVIDEVS